MIRVWSPRWVNHKQNIDYVLSYVAKISRYLISYIDLISETKLSYPD